MTLAAALRLGRVSNLPTVWTNVLAGVILAGGSAAPDIVLALILSMSLFYTGGMFLNDAFDAEFDRRHRPERPIPAGEVARNTVFLSGGAMLLAAWTVLIWAARSGPADAALTAGIAGLALAATIVAYDWRHKANPLSPLVMGLCRILVYVASGLAVAAALPRPLIGGALVLLCYLIGLTYAAKQETLHRVGSLWPLAFLAAPFAYGLPLAAASPPAAAIYAGFLCWTLYALSFLVAPRRRNVPRAVISLIAGISLLDALLVAGAGRPDLAGAALLGFAATLGFQRWIVGT